jgi:hypothetical protein
MNYGVKMQGDVYFFLHADSEPTSHFDVSHAIDEGDCGSLELSLIVRAYY